MMSGVWNCAALLFRQISSAFNSDVFICIDVMHIARVQAAFIRRDVQNNID